MDFINQILGNDWGASLLIIANLVVIESLLSVDNAAVLATMVMDLPENKRNKALKYGIIGAYVFRGLCLLFASYLVKIWWLKPIGGLYLLYLCFDYFKAKSEESEEGGDIPKSDSKLYKATVGKLGAFWSTVIMVEIMDLAFSIDNVFAAVAFTDNLYLIWIGVFIGILAMRFVAQAFVKLMEKYPFLETSAFLVIGILGLKLSTSVICHFYENTLFCQFLEGESADAYVSAFTVAIFLVPILSSSLFDFPRKKK